MPPFTLNTELNDFQNVTLNLVVGSFKTWCNRVCNHHQATYNFVAIKPNKELAISKNVLYYKRLRKALLA